MISSNINIVRKLYNPMFMPGIIIFNIFVLGLRSDHNIIDTIKYKYISIFKLNLVKFCKFDRFLETSFTPSHSDCSKLK
jgi:hypothetical protein